MTIGPDRIRHPGARVWSSSGCGPSTGGDAAALPRHAETRLVALTKRWVGHGNPAPWRRKSEAVEVLWGVRN